MKIRSNLVKLGSRLKLGDEGWGTFKVLSMSKILSTIIKILSTRLLIHSTTLLPHYGSLWGICQSLYFHPVGFTVITRSEQ
jgi:hypothetical protein